MTPDSRIALIGIIVENNDSVDELNHLLSQYAQYIIGRMGIPYRERNVSIISIAIDAPNSVISALSGKLGMLPGISAKTTYAKTTPHPNTTSE
jgi:putative iron-only hydrogenase system regulator